MNNWPNTSSSEPWRRSAGRLRSQERGKGLVLKTPSRVVRLADDTGGGTTSPPPFSAALPGSGTLRPASAPARTAPGLLQRQSHRRFPSFEPGGAKNRASLGESTPGLVPMFRPASGAGAQSVSQSIVLAQGVIPLVSQSVNQSVSVSVNAGGGVHQHGAGQTVAAHCVSQSVSAQSFGSVSAKRRPRPTPSPSPSSSAADRSGRLFSDVARASASAAQQPGGNPATAAASGGEKGFGSPGGTAPFPLRTDHLCNQHLIPEQFRKLIVPDMEKMMQLGPRQRLGAGPGLAQRRLLLLLLFLLLLLHLLLFGAPAGQNGRLVEEAPRHRPGPSAAGLQMAETTAAPGRGRPDGPSTSSPAGQPPGRGEAGRQERLRRSLGGRGDQERDGLQPLSASPSLPAAAATTITSSSTSPAAAAGRLSVGAHLATLSRHPHHRRELFRELRGGHDGHPQRLPGRQSPAGPQSGGSRRARRSRKSRTRTGSSEFRFRRTLRGRKQRPEGSAGSRPAPPP